jgi:uncharacterized Zn finger protein
MAGYLLIECPTCGQESYINHGVLHALPGLNVNRCLKCGTEVTLVSLDPPEIRVVRVREDGAK